MYEPSASGKGNKMTTLMDKINQESVDKESALSFSVGDIVKVHAKIYEGEKERVQVFGGTVIAKDRNGATATFTVRRISHGVGVEKVFPMHSPHVVKVEVERSSRVKRAKLCFLRKLTGKKARLPERRK